MLNTAMTPLLLASAPREYMGRVIAIFNPAVQLAAMASVAAAGWLASSVLRNFSGSLAGVHFGTIDTIFAAAGLLVLLAGGYALAALPRQADQPGIRCPAGARGPGGWRERPGARGILTGAAQITMDVLGQRRIRYGSHQATSPTIPVRRAPANSARISGGTLSAGAPSWSRTAASR